MNELTIVMDHWGHKELKEYLMSQNGILDVQVNNDEQLVVYLRYDPHLITPKIIKMEIFLFLDILKIPSILCFDKHSKFQTNNYTIIRDDLCCEYCFKGAVEDLFEINGIEKVESNFSDNYLFQKYDEREKITIHIKYNPNLISTTEMRQIELKLNI